MDIRPPAYLPRAPGPDEFGKNIWDTMILVGLGYPETPTAEDMNKFRLYYYFQGNVLPCPRCTFNFNLHLLKFPLDDNVFKSRNSVLNWIKNLKNEVNQNIGKPLISDEEFSDYLNNMYDGRNELEEPNLLSPTPFSSKRIEKFDNGSDNTPYWLLIILIIIILIFVYSKRAR